jgi:phage tail-like protein
MTMLDGFGFPADVNYNFIVSIGAFPLGEFQSCTNIVVNHTPFQWKEGGRNHSPHYLPLSEPKNRGELSLKWGNVMWDNLYTWMKGVEVGKQIRKEVFVVQLGRHGWPNVLYRFSGCMPVYWEGAALDASSSTWAMEELKLVYEHTTQVRTMAPTLLTAAGVI